MKRSEINRLINEAIVFFSSRQFPLPAQAFWSLEDWNKNKDAVDELEKRGIGWDLTDFGSGKFESIGLLCYTLSNGIIGPEGEPVDQPYANKVLVIKENQVTPMHHHRSKMEDIINLGGGDLQIRLYNVGENDTPDEASNLNIFHNAMWLTCKPGTTITLKPGERIRLDPIHFHEFWGAPGLGKVLVEEVSSVNDDQTDNVFIEPFGRFPDIIEDVKPDHLLNTELPGTEKFNALARRYLKAA